MNENSYKSPSSAGTFNLIIGEYHEPNNGRELFGVKLLLEERDVTAQYLGNWPYVPIYLDQYQALSPDEQWMYIPKEDGHFVIHLPSLQKVDLPILPLAAVNFMGNYFEEKMLIVKSRAGDLRVDLALDGY
jgi:hypothetical protein